MAKFGSKALLSHGHMELLRQKMIQLRLMSSAPRIPSILKRWIAFRFIKQAIVTQRSTALLCLVHKTVVTEDFKREVSEPVEVSKSSSMPTLEALCSFLKSVVVERWLLRAPQFR